MAFNCTVAQKDKLYNNMVSGDKEVILDNVFSLLVNTRSSKEGIWLPLNLVGNATCWTRYKSSNKFILAGVTVRDV